MDDKTWMNDIRRKMEGFEMPPPENLWEEIGPQANAHLARLSAERSHRRRLWMAAAVMTGALATGGGFWLATHQGGDSLSRPVASHTEVSRPAESRPVLASAATQSSPSSSCQVAEAYQVRTDDTHFAQIYPSENDSNEVSTVVESCSNSHENKERPVSAQVTRETSYSTNTLLASRHSDEDRISVSLTATNVMGSSNRQDGFGRMLAASPAPNGLMQANAPVYTQKKHRQPVRLGVAVNYRLDDRWSIGTGLTYSYLSSELTSGTDESYNITQQKLQYVGIPLNVSYTFYRHKRCSVYGTTGGMVEKCVKGKAATEFVVDGKKVSSQDEDVREKRPQYSVNAAVGVQAQIADHVGFYLEPGVSYHFDNHSDVVNIYKDTPLNFSIGLGFRYSF